MIDAAGPITGNGVEGDSGSDGYTTLAYETGVGKGLTVTPAKGDTGKTLLFHNAGQRPETGVSYNHGGQGFFFSAPQEGDAQAWYLRFYDVYPSGIIWSASMLRAYSIRCVRS